MESDHLHVPALVSIPISVNGEGLSQVPQQQLFPFVALLSQSGIISHQLQWIEQGRRKQFYVCMIADSFVADKSLLFIYLFQDRRRHIADGTFSGFIYTLWCLLWSWRTFENASLFQNRQRFFNGSFLICMFQDSVPVGSYNDPFLSSVISMVTPTWCHGPIWGNLRCGVNAWLNWLPNSHILI